MAQNRIPPPPAHQGIPPPPQHAIPPMHAGAPHPAAGLPPQMPVGGQQGAPNAHGQMNQPMKGQGQPMQSSVPGFKGFEFRKYNKSELEAGVTPSWAIAHRAELPISSLDIEKRVRTRRLKNPRRTALDEYKELRSEKMQEHVKRLVDEHNKAEKDKAMAWTFAMIECDERRLSSSKKDISHMRVYIQRSMKPEFARSMGGVQAHIAGQSGTTVNLNQLPPGKQGQSGAPNQQGQNNKAGNANNTGLPGGMPNGPMAGNPGMNHGAPNMVPNAMPGGGMPNGPAVGHPGMHHGMPNMVPNAMPPMHGFMNNAPHPHIPMPIEVVKEHKKKKDKKDKKKDKRSHSHARKRKDSGRRHSESDDLFGYSSDSSSESYGSRSSSDTDHWHDVQEDLVNLQSRVKRLAPKDSKVQSRRRSSGASRFPPVPIGVHRRQSAEYVERRDDRGRWDDSKQPIIQNFNFPIRRQSDSDGGRLSEGSLNSWHGGQSAPSRPPSDGGSPRSPYHRHGFEVGHRHHRKPGAYSPFSSCEDINYYAGPHGGSRRHSHALPANTCHHHMPYAPEVNTSYFDISGKGNRPYYPVRRNTADAVDYMRGQHRRAERERCRQSTEHRYAGYR